MPLSRYLKIFPDPDRAGSHLVYSTRKGSLVRLSTARLVAAQAGTLDEAEARRLTELAILVDDPAAEQADLAGLVMQTNARAGRFRATVVLTLACNLACPYCFEEQFRDGRQMHPDTARLLVARLTGDHLTKGRDVQLRFYGGEPLMAVPLMEAISRPLQEAAAQVGRSFSCSMVSNGTLLTRPMVERLLPLGLKSVQVTLDGPPAIHDQQRPFAAGGGSFATILANLAEVADLVSLELGGNFTRENFREFPAMLDAVLAAGLDPKRLGAVQFAPILPKSGRPASPELSGHCPACSDPWLAEATLYLRQDSLARGFKVLKPTMGICMVELENDLVVDCDGAIYKCPGLMGWPELAVGTLAEGITDYGTSHHLHHWRQDQCLECAYLPLCFGGCRLVNLLNQGDMAGLDCRKPFFDATLEQMVLQDLRSRKANASAPG